LSKHKATTDCEQKILTLVTFEGERLVHKGVNSKQAIPLISATGEHKLLKKGCPAYLCVVKSAETLELDPKEIPVVEEFLEVFQEVPGLPPDRKIEFMKELQGRHTAWLLLN